MRNMNYTRYTYTYVQSCTSHTCAMCIYDHWSQRQKRIENKNKIRYSRTLTISKFGSFVRIDGQSANGYTVLNTPHFRNARFRCRVMSFIFFYFPLSCLFALMLFNSILNTRNAHKIWCHFCEVFTFYWCCRCCCFLFSSNFYFEYSCSLVTTVHLLKLFSMQIWRREENEIKKKKHTKN